MGHRVTVTLEQLSGSPLATSSDYGPILGIAAQALSLWHDLWGNDKRLKNVLNKKELSKEMEEAIVAVTHVLHFVGLLANQASSSTLHGKIEALENSERSLALQGGQCKKCLLWTVCARFPDSTDSCCCICSEKFESEWTCSLKDTGKGVDGQCCTDDEETRDSALAKSSRCPCMWKVRASTVGAENVIGLRIRTLKKKYGMQLGDTASIIGAGEVEGGLWLLDNGKNVPRAHEGVGWHWADPTFGSANKETCGCVVVDVCSGKGIASLLLTSSLKSITGGELVSRIVMVDLASGHDAPHFEYLDAVREKPDLFSIPLEFVQLDVHSLAFERFMRSLGGSVVILGIHLCRRLSSRFVEIFNSCEGVRGMVLLPCCLPIKSSPAFSLNGVHVNPRQLYALPSPPAAWAAALLQGADSHHKNSSRAPLSSRCHTASDSVDASTASTLQTTSQCSVHSSWTHDLGKIVITACK